ncbi:MAG: hypothetical protein AABW50_02530 [Nanoarchaeota archaeon]
MTLKKLLTGQPGNVKEFVEMAKKQESLVSVLLTSYWSNDQTGYSLT